MDDREALARRFEEHRTHLRAVAYRLLGSASDADDAVQEAWLRLQQADSGQVQNLRGWLTTVVSRVCLNMLRSRESRREDPLDTRDLTAEGMTGDADDPEREALLADAVGLALLVVLDTLTPAERLAFVLHDMFAVPFEEIAPMVDRTPAAARQLASRARRRLRGGEVRDADLDPQRRVVEAYLTAIRSGDLEGLVALLHADVRLHADETVVPRGVPVELRGARPVARAAMASAGRARSTELGLVDGTVGLFMAPRGRLLVVLRFNLDAHGAITDIDVIGDPERLRQLDLAAL
jgi:RNA polymerase sigma-70 factor (ECF subfamily)